MALSVLLALALQAATPVASTPPSAPAKAWPTREADFTVANFRFRTGETLPQVRIHYTMLGQPHRDAKGEIDNAVMVLHGTGGTGKQFLQPQFADELYGPGQPLDISKYWIILPDNVGHGGSSKPSDGLHMRFPRYDYDDMVALQYRLLTDGLGIKHMRLIMGTSMGCMHDFIWGETYPDFARALMPMACQPVEIAGLNRMWRQLLIDGIEADPAWMKGEYKTQPAMGLRVASSLSVVAGAAPLNFQMLYPTREKAEAAAREASLLRFRPILMTTIAAGLGALPLAIGFGEGAELRRPLGIAIIGGLVASQFLTLLTTPVVYLALDRFRRRSPRERMLGRASPPGYPA